MLIDRFRLDGRAALVTGAGRGIGRAVAVALAEQGAEVALVARTVADLESAADEIQALGRRAVGLPADVSDTAALPEVIEAAVAALGRLDVLVNNAGGTPPRPFPDTSERFFEAAFHFNVTTAFRLTQLAVPHLLASAADRDGTGGSAVVNVSSAMGHLVGRGYAAYGTAKAALDHLTRLLAADLAPRIRVNAVAAGATATAALASVLTDELREAMVAATPLRRLGEPGDVAAAVLYLCSPAGSYLTGKVIEVDGGIDRPNLDLGLPDLLSGGRVP